MFDNYLRKIKDRAGKPLALRLSNIKPNSITLMGLVFGLGSAASALAGFYAWALFFWLINRVLDGLDGLVARLHNRQDDFGGYIDTLSDFVVYAALPVGIVLGAPSQQRFLALIAALAIFYINTASWMYLSAILEKRALRNLETQTTIVMPSGLIGGFETIIFYCLFILLPEQIALLLLIYSGLVIITIFQRLIWARLQLSYSVIKKGYNNENKRTSP